MDINKVQAEWVLGLFPAQELPEFAAQAMIQGFDGPFILEMASFHRPREMSDEIFDGALREMGREPITPLQAVRRLSRMVAERILRKQTPPATGADEILHLLRRFEWDELPEELREFRWRVDELGDARKRTLTDEQRIVELAWALLEE